MNNLSTLIQENFIAFMIICTAWPLLLGTFLFFRRKQKGEIFPDEETVKILHKECFASGKKTSGLGHSNNCLKIVVTTNEVWITSWFPFNLFIGLLGLEHRIPQETIICITTPKSIRGNLFRIEFKDPNGVIKSLDIYSKNKRSLQSAVNTLINKERQ